MSAIHRAHPRAVHAGLFRPPFAAPQRDPESRPKRVALPWLLRPGRPRFGSYGSLSAAARSRRKKPEGARARCARVRCRHTDVPSANLRSGLAESFGHDAQTTAAVWVPFSLVTFSWASKRK